MPEVQEQNRPVEASKPTAEQAHEVGSFAIDLLGTSVDDETLMAEAWAEVEALTPEQPPEKSSAEIKNEARREVEALDSGAEVWHYLDEAMAIADRLDGEYRALAQIELVHGYTALGDTAAAEATIDEMNPEDMVRVTLRDKNGPIEDDFGHPEQREVRGIELALTTVIQENDDDIAPAAVDRAQARLSSMQKEAAKSLDGAQEPSSTPEEAAESLREAYALWFAARSDQLDTGVVDRAGPGYVPMGRVELYAKAGVQGGPDAVLAAIQKDAYESNRSEAPDSHQLNLVRGIVSFALARQSEKLKQVAAEQLVTDQPT